MLGVPQVKDAVGWLKGRRGRIYRWAHVLVPAGVLFVLMALRVSGMAWVETARHRAFDAYQQLRPRAYEDAAVRVIDIDEDSLAKVGQWPWPRTLVARFVERLAAAGVSVVAFDAVFSEPDRTSPGRVVDFWPDLPELWVLKDRAKKLPDHDRLLAKSFSRVKVVTGFTLTSDENAAVPESKVAWAYGGDGPLGLLPDFPGAVATLPVLEKAAAGNGCFGFIPEHDGIVRRVPLLFRRGKTLLPALSAEALRVAQEVPGIAIKTAGGSGEASFGAHTGIAKVKIGQFVVPTDDGGRMWVHFSSAAPGRTVPAWKVLDPKADLSALEGTIAFVGTSAAGLKDLRATPLSPAAAGVDVHANITEQILLGRFLRRPDWAPGAELVFMMLIGLLLIGLVPRLSAGWGAWLAAACLFAAVRLPWEAFTRRGYLLDPVFPALAVFGVYMASTLIGFLMSETERRQVRSAFGQYLHPKLVEELAKHPEKLKLGGETREMTVLFCDIRGFTTISEQFDAHGLTQMINRFLTPMTGIIMDRFGYIDKYIGDCIMAFWNAPADDPEHARNACAAALRMLERLRELDEEWRAEAEAEGRKFIPIRIGVGLNTGPCCVGNMGADQKFNYSVLGDDVNLASRLEGQSKYYGVETVIGPRTREQVPDFATLELDLIKVKGKTKPVRIFTLLGGPELEGSPAFREHRVRHDAMLAAYRRQDWGEAGRLLEECRRASLPLQGLYDLYAKRLEAFAAASPGPDWDGTFTATSK